MIIPTKQNNTKMLPQEFEQFVIMLLRVAVVGIPDVEVKHNELIEVSDGEYQIDGTIRFEVMGVKYLTLVECKMYKSPVSREKVQVLYDKLRAIGAQKGILATTSYFQSGAIKYASAHGIALVQIIDGKLTYCVRSNNPQEVNYPADLPKYEGIAQYSIKEGIIGCSSILNTKYLSEFLICKEDANYSIINL